MPNGKGQLVVVFGGGGYIGSSLLPHLLAEGCRVRVFDNFLFGRDGVKELLSPELEIIEGDICDTRAVSAALNGAETVILLSAVVGRRVQEVRWASPRSVNLLASSVVLDAALEHGAHRFIFASSDSVYGAQSGVMYETSLPSPVSLYARLKLRMEERILQTKQRDFHPIILRIATCYGYSPKMRFDLVANMLVLDAVCRKEITIEGGEQCRSLVHVDDAARSFVACLKAHANLISGEIFNVGSPEQTVQVNQMANIVKTLVPDTRITIKEVPPDLVGYSLSCSKIEKLLDFKPSRQLVGSMTQLRDMLTEGRFGDPYSLKYHNF
jgi:nucleoside-diphosphate-sugar epimerase